MRQRAVGLLAALCALAPAAAAAQPCHAPPQGGALEPGLALAATAEAASYRLDRGAVRYRGTYRGAALEASWAASWLSLSARLPWYRLDRNGAVFSGAGDLLVAGRAVAWRDGALALGPELAASLATGRAEEDLGMGHAMVMPGAFAAWSRGAWSASLLLSYGHALDGGSGHHHAAGGLAPIVSPMNRREWAAALAAGWLALPWLALRATGGAALPALRDGTARAEAGLGAELRTGGLTFGLAGLAPLLSGATRWRATVAIGYRLAGSSASP